MKQFNPFVIAGLATIAFSLTACGGGGTSGGGGLDSTPPPPPPPPQTVAIFSSPQVGEFTSVGSSAAGSGGYENAGNPVGTISTNQTDQPRIRYTAGGVYEVQLPSGSYDRLVSYGSGTDDSVLTTATNPQSSQLVISKSRNAGYRYSELAFWTSGPLNRFGAFGFGVPTPNGAVPVTGSATYSGIVSGETDIFSFDQLAGAYYREPVSGTVNLNFDFAQGQLAGQMSLALAGYLNTSLGTFRFTDTVFSVGGTTYSGRFDTQLAGQNFFLGQFTGPNAEETIGAWALTFHFSGDGQDHQAFGAWIAKH